MKVKRMNGISTISQTTYIKIPLTSDQTMASISVSALGDSSVLTLDSDGDEVSDFEIQPTAILDGEVSTDLIAPVIVFNNIENGARYLHSATLAPNISFSDSLSGVAITSIELDGTLIESGVSIDLFNLSLGSHALVATARDKVGNTVSALRNFEIFSSKESVVSDIGRLKSLGGISDGFDEVLIGRVNELTLENRASFLSELKLDKGRCYLTAQAYEALKTNVEGIEL
jgi:hypothetical protein